MTWRLRILFVTAEVTPFARTGGLGDVCGSLPAVLATLGHDVRIVMPLYQTVREQEVPLSQVLEEVEMPSVFGTRRAQVWQGQLLRGKGESDKLSPPVPVYFIEQDDYFARPGLYGDASGDYPDNPLRFLFFSRAVLALPERLNWFPHVIHCHDWHTGLIPAFLRFLPELDARLRDAGTVFTIHNLAYQGYFPSWVFEATGLPAALYQPSGMEFYGGMNFMKAGLAYADRLTTVSPTYAEEICTPLGGFGLDGVLRERRQTLTGIVNGIDYTLWNPATDSLIAAHYSATDPEGKAVCKIALLRSFGLSENPETPVIGMVTRLVDQKGVDVVAEAMSRLLALNVRFVMVGSGEARYEQMFTDWARRAPERIGVRLGFSDALAHQVQAGSDMLLMPSRYEPCGLTQLYALRYGTLPIVRAVGGLKDTVVPFAAIAKQGTGFVFEGPTADALLGAVRRAIAVYEEKETWTRLIRNAMTQDFSWDHSAARYVSLYRQLVSVRQNPPQLQITSGTEPVMRLYAESGKEGMTATLLEEGQRVFVG